MGDGVPPWSCDCRPEAGPPVWSVPCPREPIPVFALADGPPICVPYVPPDADGLGEAPESRGGTLAPATPEAVDWGALDAEATPGAEPALAAGLEPATA